MPSRFTRCLVEHGSGTPEYEACIGPIESGGIGDVIALALLFIGGVGLSYVLIGWITRPTPTKEHGDE